MSMTSVVPDIVAFVMNLPEETERSLRTFAKTSGRQLRILLILDVKVKVDPVKQVEMNRRADIVLEVDFSKPEKIAQALRPYQESLLAITCRSEQSMARFAAIIPHVPYLRTPTTESLTWAADKYEMRKRMKIYAPEIVPRFTLVRENSKKERARVTEKIGFPMIVKPTNLSGSLLVSICYHEAELEKTLRTLFRKLRQAYTLDHRLEEPQVIAEEFMDGDMYSVDSYVSARGKVEHCPLVKVVTGKKIGHDDFFGYLQITPPVFKRETILKAEAAAEKAIHALGLRSTLTHTELMKVDDEWKVIEIGARMGGFREIMHKLTCDIDHGLNDVLVRIPQKINLSKKCSSFACTMKWYANKEGRIIEMKGIKKIEQLESFYRIDVNKKVGDKAVFARHGGRSIFNLFMHNPDRSKLLADIRRVEQLVEIKVKGKGE